MATDVEVVVGVVVVAVVVAVGVAVCFLLPRTERSSHMDYSTGLPA